MEEKNICVSENANLKTQIVQRDVALNTLKQERDRANLQGQNQQLAKMLAEERRQADEAKAAYGNIVSHLKDLPYQTLVAGFTDNSPIGAKLQEKYPTNWELAGARAASVVRLLEANGVDSERLIALSFGEHRAVADNDSAEGRKQNRRIEIRLRPVEFSN